MSGPSVTAGRDPDRLLARAGVAGDPRRDQHFLVDDRVLDRIAGYARDLPGELQTVLEIGPGTGALTDRLLGVADRVVAVERDEALVAFLREEFADEIDAGRLEILAGDALEVEIPAFDALVANLPYGVSSQLIFRFLRADRPMIVMVQREFADRLVAAPGTSAYGRLTVTAGHRAAATILEPVPPTAFQPPPPVESAIVRLDPREPAYAVGDADAFLALVTGLFTQRRKTLRNALRNTTHMTGVDAPDAVLARLPADWADRRPETFAPAEFARIAQAAFEPTEAS